MKYITPRGLDLFMIRTSYPLQRAVLFFALLGISTVSAQQATAPTPEEDAIKLSAFTVTAVQDDGYRSIQTESGSRTVENLKDVANTIQVLNRQVIEDLAATSMIELATFSISGEATVDNINLESYSFRGIASPYQNRDGFMFYQPVDTFNMERAELVRGPNAFLYGEADPGGGLNMVGKRATGRKFTKARIMTGSYDLFRFELDDSRKLAPNLAFRSNFVFQKGNDYLDYIYRNTQGIAAALRYQPFPSTTINVSYEYNDEKGNRATMMGYDRYRTTLRTGAVGTYTTASGGPTLYTALGKIYNTVGTKQSTGISQYVTELEIRGPRTLNFDGPNAQFDSDSQLFNVAIEQKVGKRLNLQFQFNLQDAHRDRIQTASGGTAAGGIYLDKNPTLPDGTTNPYFDQFYYERYFTRRYGSSITRDWRLSAIYNLDQFKFMKQRVMFTAAQHQDNPMQLIFSEFVDPSSPLFTGAFVNADTAAAMSSNNTTLSRNYFRRRFYIKDGDGAQLTNMNGVPGTSVWLEDSPLNGGAAGRTDRRRFYSPAMTFGLSGAYFNGRLRTMVGWRKDGFLSSLRRTMYNPVTKSEYHLDPWPRADTTLHLSAWNYGGVLHMTKWLSASYNKASSYRISLGEGQDDFYPGTKQGFPVGNGYDAGLRWHFFDGRLESNWTRYSTLQENNRGLAAPTSVLLTELASLYGPALNTGSSVRDIQTIESKGYEFETVATLFDGFSLTWNFATTEIATSDTAPQMRSIQADARSKGYATPELDRFLSQVVDGTPQPGYTKIRTNLLARYIFKQGPLKGFMIGGGFQLRDKVFLGNYDRDNDGVAEKIWGPGYEVYNGLFGYSTKLWKRDVGFALNINNLLNKDYYRTSSLSNAAWGQPRTFRFTTTVNF